MFDYDCAWLGNLLENAFVLKVVSIRAVHRELPLATRLKIKRMKCIPKSIWPPPLGERIGIGEGIKNPLACMRE